MKIRGNDAFSHLTLKISVQNIKMKNTLVKTFFLHLLLFNFLTGLCYMKNLKKCHPCIIYSIRIPDVSSRGLKVDCSGKNLTSIPKNLPKEAANN